MEGNNTQGGQGYSGQQGLTSPGSEFNTQSWLVDSLLGDVRTIVPVQVVAVSGGGTDGPALVDVHPLINQIDGVGNATPHGDVLGLPVIRWQAGSSGIILDPKVGDIGLALIADRDISALKASRAQANPGSFRRFDLADGIYLGGILGPAITQYVQFTDEGINIVGNLAVTGSVTVTGGVTAGFDTVDAVTLQHHVHPSNGQPPTPGT